MNKTKLTKEQKEKYKLSVKMTNSYTKELKKLAIDAAECPFDYGPGLDMFVCFLRYMRDYYKLGYNVWAMEKRDAEPSKYKNRPTRLESLQLVLDEYDAWQGCENKYFITHATGGIETGQGLILNGEQQDCWLEYLLTDPNETLKAFKKEYKEHRKKFFMLINKYLEDWGD